MIKAVELTLRLNPIWLTYPLFSVASATGVVYSRPMGANNLVNITILSRGSASFFIAFPRITSDRPFEYMFAVSKVLMPASYANLICEMASSSPMAQGMLPSGVPSSVMIYT